jgi:hypothetical protein
LVAEGGYDTRKAAREAWEYIGDKLLLSNVNRQRVELIMSIL